MINWQKRYDDTQAAREIRLLLCANNTTFETMYGVLGSTDSKVCKALARAADRLEYQGQWGHIERKRAKRRTKKRGAK